MARHSLVRTESLFLPLAFVSVGFAFQEECFSSRPSAFPAVRSLKYALAVPGQPLFKVGMDRICLYFFELAMLAFT